MKISHLRHAVMVDRLGSFTAAADELNITQSSVTKSVAWLESELGYLLFDRRARGVTPTQAGREFIDRAARIVSDVDTLSQDVTRARGERDEILRVGVAPPSLEGLLNRAIRATVRDGTEFRILVQSGSSERIRTQLTRGDLDIIVGPTEDLANETELRLEPLPDFIGKLFARRDHPLLRLQEDVLAETILYPLIVPDLTGQNTQKLIRVLDQNGQGFRRLHILDNFPMVSSIVMNSDAIGIVSQSFARTASFRARFRTLNADFSHSMPLSVAWRARWQPSRPMNSFLHAVNRYPPI